MSEHTIDTLLTAIAEGDALALGELPHVLSGQSSARIEETGKALRPLLIDMDTGLMTVTETMIADAYVAARKRERLEAMLPPGFTDPVERKRDWKEQPGEPMGSVLVETGMLSMRNLMNMLPTWPIKNPKLGLHKGECRVEKPVITERQPGQELFTIDGVDVYAGSYKAAVKKARKLRATGSLRSPNT